MTLDFHKNSCHIARHVGKQGARYANVPQVADEKFNTEQNDENDNINYINNTNSMPSTPTMKNHLKTRLLKGKKSAIISSLNARTLRNFQLNELVASADKLLNDAVCVQEHHFIHEDTQIKEHDAGKQWKLLTSSAWKNNMDSSIGGVAILLSPHPYKFLNSIKSITPRILVANFNGNPQTTVICCYSPTNVIGEVECEKFYDELSHLTRQIPKHNVLIIGGDFNAHLGQDNGYKFAYHQQTNRDGTMLCNFLKEQNLIPLNTYFQKQDGQRWTYTAPNGAKAQLDYLIINKKWKNSAKDCRAFNSFEGVKSDHRVISAKVRLTLRTNKPKSSRNPPYDWSSLSTNPVITNSFTIQLKNRFNALQQEEIGSSPNNTYNNFISACEDASKETISLKKKTKKRVPWDSEEIVSKRKILHRMAEIKNSEPT